MPSRNRPDPVIPDHEILRKIGGGAYGEVWLGRGVTGALRAVKVVWREDFEDARGFEREFEGILKFEPISRDHPGLVNILHVGRSPDAVSFYYYVMELGDDVRAGQDINPIEYEPRTLQADTRQTASCQLDTAVCIDVGLRLAEALDHLHELGLAHRDVKPSNVIFVNGKAKLADIGLVAARGQRTFVGTEGFVPPEGPGSAQADVYSLGKVLYEIATGKDRLDFPELPDILPAGPDRKRWLELNKIICDICEPRLSKRTISTAGELAEALRRLQRGKKRRKSGAAVWMTTLVLTVFSGWMGYETIKDSDWLAAWTGPPPAVQQIGRLRVISTPEGADVYDESGRVIGTTPTEIIEAPVGKKVTFTVRKRGFLPQQTFGTVHAGAVNVPMIFPATLQVFSPPRPGEPWEDHLANFYQPKDAYHVSSGFVLEGLWERFIQVSKRDIHSVDVLDFSQNGKPCRIVLASKEEADAFCDWLRVEATAAGYLTEDHEVVPQFDEAFQNPGLSEKAIQQGLKPFRIVVRQIDYSEIVLTSDPPGAEVVINGKRIDGTTEAPLRIPKVKPGPVEMILILEGYEPFTWKGSAKAGGTQTVSITLKQNQGVVFGRPWQNGIEMRFVPVGQDLMASIWETRVRDYDRFVKENPTFAVRQPDFAQDENNPVIYVSRDDAREFCQWLTTKERRSGHIAASHLYRLPTDEEWSLMAGLKNEVGYGPGGRDAQKARMFPWGFSWPPPEKFGNYADSAAGSAPLMPTDRTIANYNDGYPYTSPVGSFAANENGIFDLSGNAQEWVDDDYLPGSTRLGVLRGGGWNSYLQENLFIGSRSPQDASFRDNIYGFRVVLAKVPPEVEPPIRPLEDPIDMPMPPEDPFNDPTTNG
jgi:eukaryotic-like serine/threonine-protein kinase